MDIKYANAISILLVPKSLFRILVGKKFKIVLMHVPLLISHSGILYLYSEILDILYSTVLAKSAKFCLSRQI